MCNSSKGNTHFLLTRSRRDQNFRIQPDALYLWSDSEIVLEWLRAHPSTWTTFVANRVALIQDATKSGIWRHVPCRQNPADVISRGAYVDELLTSFWFAGPAFLLKPCDQWPANKLCSVPEEDVEERRKQTTTLAAEVKKNSFIEWLEGRSDYVRTQKRVAHFLCIFRRIKGRHDKLPPLTTTMLDEALIRIAFCLQKHYFNNEYNALKRDGVVPSTSKVKCLSVFIESCYGVDILRVGGRLKNAKLPYDEKHPILLPGESNFVRSYIRYVHEKHMHVGTQALMAIMRQRFWIVNARKVVRS
ncbi:PREDICTED: uncharacterized protein LOC108376477 [Rhagoletis zephyria]|uniref:uncharacterized protein LOC108376477 n=1 Tax=Rhagoletis zephyria TaxID=28612 RepID=UPI0008114922|nr:PREDICTED: uncharacterized protein LOC108376477 [Rhagoletis zephyria]